jgi:hypothetical protein
MRFCWTFAVQEHPETGAGHGALCVWFLDVVSADFRARIQRNLGFEQIGGLGGTSGANLNGFADSGKYHKRYGGVEFFLVHMKLEGRARDLLAFHGYLQLHEMK